MWWWHSGRYSLWDPPTQIRSNLCRQCGRHNLSKPFAVTGAFRRVKGTKEGSLTSRGLLDCKIPLQGTVPAMLARHECRIQHDTYDRKGSHSVIVDEWDAQEIMSVFPFLAMQGFLPRSCTVAASTAPVQDFPFPILSELCGLVITN